MKRFGLFGLPILAIALSWAGTLATAQADVRVRVVRLPDSGIQPQAVVGTNGAIHVVYFAGTPAGGDFFYVQLLDSGEWSAPIRVNSQPNSAIATGTVRGARIAVGRNNRVHIAWNGSSQARPTAPGDGTPMLYSRLTPKGDAFEAQRNVIQHAVGLDGGGAIAAGPRGTVMVAWHAGGAGATGDEGDRRVWLATSADDGSAFSRERAISPAEEGACGCCGMDAAIDATGSVFMLYRSARKVVNRDNYLLTSTDEGKSFRAFLLQPWNIGGCPMSTFDLASSSGRTYASWETAGQVQFAQVRADGPSAGAIHAPAGDARNRRHPSLAIDSAGRVLMSWSEGTAWQRGGAAAWQLFEPDGRPIGSRGRAEGVPVWGLTSAVYSPKQGFVVIF